jgi:hypothetical protein
MPARGVAMADLPLKYVQQFRDKKPPHRWRYYFRRAGKTYGSLPGPIGSHEFNAAYAGFLDEKPKGQPRSGAKTFGRLVTDFYGSVEFANLRPSSKASYRSVLEPLAAKYGARMATDMPPEMVRKIYQEIGSTRPGLANLARAVLSVVMKYAISAGWRKDNPVVGLKRYKLGSHHSWTDTQLATYEARWPLGTPERLAYAVLLYTVQRGGDAVKMNRAALLAGGTAVKQQKTGAELFIPFHPELVIAIKAMPANGLTILGDKDGRPISRMTLTKLIKGAVEAAGLDPACKAHGLRKAAMRRMAELGATGKELASMSGHKTLDEVENYTRAADQRGLAESAITKLQKPKK